MPLSHLFFFSLLLPLGLNAQLNLKVDNKTGYPVDVHYQQNGQYTKHTTIPIGESMNQQVSPNFTWYFSVLQTKLIGQYITTAESNQSVVLDQNTLAAAGVQAPSGIRQGQSGSGTAPQGTQAPPPPPPPSFSQAPIVPNDVPPAPVFNPADVQVSQGTPITGPLVKWFEGLPESRAIITAEKKYLNVQKDRTLSVVISDAANPAMTTATFVFHEIPGKKDTYHIQNMYYLDSYLYVDANAQQQSPIKCAPEGKSLPTGEWKVTKGTYFHTIANAAKPHLHIAVKSGQVGLSSYVVDENHPEVKKHNFEKYMYDSIAHKEGDALMLFDVKSFQELSKLVPAFTKMAKNFQELEARVKAREDARKTAIARKEAEVKVARERRMALAREPKIVGGGVGTDNLAVRLGFEELYDTKEGGKAIQYKFETAGPKPYLSFAIHDKSGVKQRVNLNINPQVAAWVDKDGNLFVGVDTDDTTTVNVFHTDGTPSSDKATDGNWYIGNVTINKMFQYGREVLWFPTVENRTVSFGSSSDVTKGINVSAEEILGADVSESQGTNVNWEAREFDISGKRGSDEYPQAGFMRYSWDSCGLADKPKSTEPCTYNSPVDLWDLKTLGFRKIPASAHSLNGLKTRTVFSNYFPVSGIGDRLGLRMDVQVQMHMAKRVRTNTKNTKNKGWEDFKAGFTFVWRPDLWDFNESFQDQHLIKEVNYKPLGFTYTHTMKIWLYLHISDLWPHMKGYDPQHFKDRQPRSL